MKGEGCDGVKSGEGEIGKREREWEWEWGRGEGRGWMEVAAVHD